MTTTVDEHTHPHPVVRGGLALWALFVGLAMLMIGNGLNLAVLGVRLVGEGFSVRTSGYVMACYFVGFLVGPPVVRRWLATVGHIRVFAGLAAMGAASVLVHAVWIAPVPWALMRFVFGFCMVGLYITIESWLNDASTPADRGRTLAVYMIVHTGGLGVGQLLLATGDPAGFTLFAVASVLVSLSFVPMALAATTDAPAIRVSTRVGFGDVWRVAPTGVVGMVLIGAATGTLFALGAVYATSVGLGAGQTAAFLAAPALGALLFQWPVGWTSDRFPRRGIIFLVAVAATLTAVALAFFWLLAIAFGSLVVYVAWRLVVREGLPLDRQGDFVSVPARGTDLAVQLATRPFSTSRELMRRKQPM